MGSRRVMIQTSIPFSYPEQQIPHYTEPDLAKLIEQYDQGIDTKNAIIEQTQRLALSIAGIHAARWPNKADEIGCMALFALCLAVDRFLAKKDRGDSNICGYITGTVYREVRIGLMEDTSIRVPNKSSRRKKAAGNEIKHFYRSFEPQDTLTQPDTSYDVKDLIVQLALTTEEEVVLELRLRGHTDVEISGKLKRSESYVWKLRKGIGNKLLDRQRQDG